MKAYAIAAFALCGIAYAMNAGWLPKPGNSETSADTRAVAPIKAETQVAAPAPVAISDPSPAPQAGVAPAPSSSAPSARNGSRKPDEAIPVATSQPAPPPAATPARPKAHAKPHIKAH